MKYNFEFALDDNIITQKECDELLKIAKNLYYPRRSFAYVVKKSSLNDEKKRGIAQIH